MVRKQICCALPDEVLKKFEQIDNETGVPVSRQIEMKLLGYSIVKEDYKTQSNDTETIFNIKDLSYSEAKIMILDYIGEKITILELADNLHLDLDQTAVIFSRILKGD